MLGVWAHRQALAAQAAGAEVQVLVLHRLVPPRARLPVARERHARSATPAARSPGTRSATGCESPTSRTSPRRAALLPVVGRMGGARAGASRCAGCAARAASTLIHAHNAVPAADAVRRAQHRRAAGRLRARRRRALHGPRSPAGREAVGARAGRRRLVLANSRGIAELARADGARETRVVHLGADPPDAAGLTRDAAPALVTVGHLVARKRHADVLRALAVLRDRHPTLRYVIVGEGPERLALEGLAARLGIRRAGATSAVSSRPREAIERARRCTLFVMPSTEEAFGVAYIEAMAGGLPAIGCRGEPGPEEIAAAGDGFVLVPPGDIERLTQRIDELLSDPAAAARGRPPRAGHGRRPLHLGALRRADGRGVRACAR